MSLLSFDANDPSFNLVKSGAYAVHNKAGLFGAYASGFLNDIFGIGSMLWPIIFAAMGGAYISIKYTMHWWRWCGLFLLTICLLVIASAVGFSIGDLSGGGMVGNSLYFNARRYLSPVGSFLLWFFVFLIGLQMVCNFSWTSLCARIKAWAIQIAKKRGMVLPRSGKGENTGSSAAPLSFLKRLLIQLPDIKAPALSDLAQALRRRLEHLGRGVQRQPQGGAADARADDMANAGEAPIPEKHAPVRLSALKEMNESLDLPSEALDSPETAAEAARETSCPTVKIDDPVAVREAPKSIRILEDSPGIVPLPSPDLLALPSTGAAISKDDLAQKGQKLMTCLKNFDIEGELVRITPGPVVIMYEVRLGNKTRLSRIVGVRDELALALKATTVRIQAIPGSDTVGVEIPNDHRETVNFRELVESEEFHKDSTPLKMILGKDVAGKPYMADLAKMPHLLIAGATGAGKSVCLNAILVSLLYHSQPSDMRLLLIDPKRMEMAAYADLPHLVHPVVTEVDDAKNALAWAVQEMQDRNKMMAMLGSKNVIGYNQKLATFKNDLPPDLAALEPLPYIVIVIDELADLMMTAAREVETSIVRLAQLARAAGIHMILATQRPSVDVVTGLIKANFPCRISFQVTSKHDSRTILDEMGAELLLGRGDMLFKPSGGRTTRLHGPYVSEEEVQAVADHWRRHQEPNYNIDFSQWTPAAASSPQGSGNAKADPLYADARAFVLEQGRASISLLQRHLNIGFNRSARLMEQFESEGIIGPADGSKPRKVIR